MTKGEHLLKSGHNQHNSTREGTELMDVLKMLSAAIEVAKLRHAIINDGEFPNRHTVVDGLNTTLDTMLGLTLQAINKQPDEAPHIFPFPTDEIEPAS